MEPGLNFQFGNENVNIFGKPIFFMRITRLFQSFIKLTQDLNILLFQKRRICTLPFLQVGKEEKRIQEFSESTLQFRTNKRSKFLEKLEKILKVVLSFFILTLILDFNYFQDFQGHGTNPIPKINSLLESGFLGKNLLFFFWNQTQEEESFLTGKFGISNFQQDLKSKTLFESTDEFQSNSLFKSKNLSSKNTKSKSFETSLLEKDKTNYSYISSFIRSYTNISISVQELLSAGFTLSFALEISKASYNSKEEFLKLFHSLSVKEQTKIFVLLKKKNPKHILKNSILPKDKR